MSNIIQAHRGSKTYMTSGVGRSLVLQEGEIFVEYPDAGLAAEGTKLKVGDGVTAYSGLPYIVTDSGDSTVSTIKCLCKRRYGISPSSWSNSADANNFYTYTVNLRDTLDVNYPPNIYLAGEDDITHPTDDEKSMYALLEEANLTSSTTLVLYASTKPNEVFYIFIEGKELDELDQTLNDYFDPVTNIATESDFLSFIETGMVTNKVIGKKVTLSNSSGYYNNGQWSILEWNHDIDNPEFYYDLIATNGIRYMAFDSNNGKMWRRSSIRTWLNDTFYNGFSSDIRDRMEYISAETWSGSSVEDKTYTHDKVIIPSAVEIGFSSGENIHSEGSKYIMFSDNASRIKRLTGTTTNKPWWTRSCDKDYNTDEAVWYAAADGSIYSASANTSSTIMVVPIIRIFVKSSMF